MRELERRVMLSVLDRKWREHLYEMDYLREGIGLRAMAQRDPLVEYQREGYDLFAAMMDGIKEESVGFLFNLEVQVDTTPGLDDEPAAELAEQATASAQTAPAPPPVEHPAIVAKGLARPSGPKALTYTAPSVDGEGGSQQVERSADDGDAVLGQMYAGTPRNAPCPCGSGRKFKRCHGDPSMRTA